MFSSYLNYYMWAFNVKNCDLAKEMFVDPSLISKWRTGKRIPSQEVTYKIAEVLVRMCRTESVQLKLCTFLNIHYSPRLFLEEPERIARQLTALLLSDSAAAQPAIPPETPEAPGGPEVVYHPLRQSADFKPHIFRLMNTALSRSLPFQVLIYCSDSMVGLAEDQLFMDQWRQLIRLSRMMQASVKLIYHPLNGEKRGIDYIKVFSPLKSIDNFSLYNLALRDSAAVTNSFVMVIPRVGALCSLRLGPSANRYLLHFTDEDNTARLEHDFQQLLAKSVYTSERQHMDYRQFSSFFTSRLPTSCRDSIFYFHSLPLFTIPTATLKALLYGAGLGDSIVNGFLSAHRKLRRAIDIMLERGGALKIVLQLQDLHFHPEEMEGVSISHSAMYFGKPLTYTRDVYEQHVAGTLEFLQNSPGLRLMITKEELYPADVMLGFNSYLMDFLSDHSEELDISYQQAYGCDMFAYLTEAISAYGLNCQTKNYIFSQFQNIIQGRNMT